MKKRNEDNHNSLGEPDDQLPAEVLKKLNELLERLHGWENLNIIKLKNLEQFKNSKIIKCKDENNEKFEREKNVQINIYEKGSQHIDTQINWGASPPTPFPLARLPVAFLAGERGVDGFEKFLLFLKLPPYGYLAFFSLWHVEYINVQSFHLFFGSFLNWYCRESIQ